MPPKELTKPQERQEIRRQQRLAQLLVVASQQFAIKGYEAATLDMIAREMGLTKTGLYNYVHSKEEIAALILEGAITHLSESLVAIEGKTADPREILHQIIAEHVESLAHHPASPLLIMHFDQILDPETFPELYALRHRYEIQLRDVIERGIRQGAFAVDDPKLASLFLLGAVNWIARWFPAGQDDPGLSARYVGQWFAQVIVGGLRAPDSSAGPGGVAQ